jgi:hypothetical protein
LELTGSAAATATSSSGGLATSGGQGGATSGTGVGGAGGGVIVQACSPVGAEPPMAACPALRLAPGLVTPATTEVDSDQPTLVDVCDVAPSVALVYGNGASVQDQRSAEVASFDGWGAWPPASPTGVRIMRGPNRVAADVVLAAPHLSDPDLDFAVVGADFASGLYRASRRVTLDGRASFEKENGGGVPLVLATPLDRTGLLSVGSSLDTADDAEHMLNFVLVPGAKHSVVGTEAGVALACATTPLAVAAAPAPQGIGGYLLGVAAGTPLNPDSESHCAINFPAVGPATHLTFSVIANDWPPQIGSQLDAPKPVIRMRMAHLAAGAWAVWSVGDATLEAARLDATADVTSELTLAADSGPIDSGSFDVAQFGPGFVVGMVVIAPDDNATIELHVYDPSGLPISSASIPANHVAGPLSLVSSRTSDQLLVAWSSAASPGAPRSLQLARVDCASP